MKKKEVNTSVLDNYKSMHKGTAKDRGCLEEFMKARTKTQAKKILFGPSNANIKKNRYLR
jgi:hypothetical protein